MSASWKTHPIDAQWRRLRLFILERDGYVCAIKGPKCTGLATTVDHLLGRAVSEHPKDLRASCGPCNWRYRPTPDPQPEPRTRW